MFRFLSKYQTKSVHFTVYCFLSLFVFCFFSLSCFKYWDFLLNATSTLAFVIKQQTDSGDFGHIASLIPPL